MMSRSPEEFTIHVEGKTLVCDKAILREGSEYFRAMFDSNMIESRANETTLQDQSYEVVKTLVDSMKSGELEISDNVEELVEGATMLQVGSAIRSCTTYLEGTLDDSNCLSLTKFSETFGLDSVYNLAKRHSLYYFNKVVKHGEFLSLGQQELIDYLSEKYLNVETELNVLDAIDLWVNSNSANEKTESLAAILECFHPEDLMQGEWEEAIKKPVLADTEAGKRWLELNPKPSSTTEQQYRDLPMMFLTVGGIKTDFQCADADSPVTDICRFDPEEKCFKPFRSLHDIYPEVGNKMGYSICTFERYMYISGGQADLLRQVYETKVWRFDSFTLKWEHLTDMLSCRRHHGTCASEGSYFVLGGFGKFRKCLDTFEEYDVEQDIWKQLPTIPKGVCKYEAVLYNQRIFIFANTSHYYDIGTKSWVDIIPANLRTRVYPLVYNKCVYTFPKLEYSDDLDYDFFRAKKVLLLCAKYDKSCEKINTIPYSYNFQLGGNVVIVKKRFFTIQWLNKDDQLQLACGFMEDLENFTLLSDSSVSGCRVKRPYLVALPFFPDIQQ